MTNKIQKMALTLAILSTIAVTSCRAKSIKGNDNQTKIEEQYVDYDINININTFEDVLDNTLVITRYTSNMYDISGKYIGKSSEFAKGYLLKKDIYSNYYLVKLEDGNEVIISSNEFYIAPNLVNTTFTDIKDNKEKVFTEYTDIYDNNGIIISAAWDNMECRAVATNGEYTLIVKKNNETDEYDGLSGFVKNESLIDKYNQVNFYAYANKNIKLYCEKELISEAKEYSVSEGQMLKVLFITDNYAGISLEGGRTTAYINVNDLELIDYSNVVNDWFSINAYHYLSKDAYLFNDQSFNSPDILLDMYQKVYVIKSNGEWSYVLTDTGKYGYVETFLLYKLPNDIFIDVDFSEQIVRLFNNYEEIYNTYCVTGKDNTPTDEGYFDIDDKVLETYLKAYRNDGSLEYNTYVDYWMPYNAGEGLHDASWQNGHFGDINYYHTNGSHGCVNLPNESAKYIYENIEIGTRVLVHK